PTRRDVAMTGEITLHGRVLPIGGLKEKTMAAYASGIKTVLIPKGNEKDLDEIDKEAKENLRFILCESVEDAFREVLLDAPSESAKQDAPLLPRRGESIAKQLC
ncbi:MAG: endopeptidase La, partial [Clostridia bacterium]|nr:endopeptidase La [Clostridia bacterium]